MRRRVSVSMDQEADTPPDADGIAIGLHLMFGFLAITGLVVLTAAGASFYSERHMPVQGIVVAHRIVPANTILMAGTRGPRAMTAPERRVLLIREDRTRAVHSFDVSTRFWSEAHEQDHVRREGGAWHVANSPRR